MPRPSIDIPLHDDLKSLRTLLDEGYNQVEIVEYYNLRGIPLSRGTIQNKIKELRRTNEQEESE
ncbi:hypothetical protein Metho_1242 [Methanomethylovorans hollandica DSM 15978]|uniref:Uncharacterized protein n=1 Tax=Methanomethylovorans hollandica (strain DSM 15978 / NBRC 107637 / DMS1) TaxID=867904 RepID=L0KVK9_METHD|nr:hypothetical protein [Methanomethylovorans hollandica]AGB49472.1 hypothetical protein Metho_1242 [Methanomethylovorans hollandica DSM 15978]